MVGIYNKISKFGENLWNEVNLASSLAPLKTSNIDIPVVNTVVDAFGSIVNGVNEIMATNAINKEIKKWNKQNEEKVKELNEYAKGEANEAENQRKKKEKAELDYYKNKMVKLTVLTQEQINNQNKKYTQKEREKLQSRKFNH
jgi:hypothetical protein